MKKTLSSRRGGLNLDPSLGSSSYDAVAVNTRKVVKVVKSKSFDILPHVEIKGEWLSSSNKIPKCSKIQDRKASKFSCATRCVLLCSVVFVMICLLDTYTGQVLL